MLAHDGFMPTNDSISHAAHAGAASLKAALERYWGYDSFRPLQKEAMTSVLGGRDSVVVLPTGGGKSLCFQVPAVCLPGMAVVVSPLISLMKDQVDALRACGVPAACVNSALSFEERKQVAADVRAGKLKLLYVAPERLVADRTIEFLKSANVSFIAVDEAHCISSWGHDFRPEYRALRRLKDDFPNIGVHAYTATATEQVRDDIARELCLTDAEVLVGSFDRPNLIYKVERRNQAMRQMRSVIDRHPGESGIVYCISRAEVDRVSTALAELGYRALPYHAGMSDEDRHNNQEAFIQDRADIVVATVAFGMGIDKSNVRYVVHCGMPKSLENYQQESGRAGRDGLEAECWLLYSGRDFHVWETIINDSPPEARDTQLGSLARMYDFCTGVVCRHRALVNHFGQEFEAEPCQACDVCLGELDLVDDALVIGQKILSCVVRLEQRFGGEYTAMVLTGSKDQRIVASGHDRLSTWGLLKDVNRRTVRDWIEQLAAQNFLARAGEYNTLQVTPEGRRLLRGEVTPRLLRPRPSRSDGDGGHSGAATDSWEGVDRGLFDRLKTLRTEKAADLGIAAYMVFSDATLRDMARRRPSSLDRFREVKGVGDKKCTEYGPEFLDLVAEHCRERELPMDVQPEPAAAVPVPRRNAVDGPSASALATFPLFREGKSVEEVAQQFNRALSTTHGYLQDYLRHERVTDPSPWVDSETAERIREAATTAGTGRLKPIYEALEGKIGYEAIRTVVTCLRNTTAPAANGG